MQALSYYKIFGYPTGLGALLVRRDALPLLRKRFFGGGTVAVSVADADYHRWGLLSVVILKRLPPLRKRSRGHRQRRVQRVVED